ncbi:MAG: helical backbone metal receptor [Candidatus Bathyarchaeota archaeon]|nr:helical backbone metal receptor [Candidatus Bathyarchaeota archaeon]
MYVTRKVIAIGAVILIGITVTAYGLWIFILQFKGAPIASFTYSPANPIIYGTVFFDGSTCHDPDGQIVNYTWSFGDGNITVTDDPFVEHRYASIGNHTVTLNVTDNNNIQSSTAVTLYTTVMIVVDDLGREVMIDAPPRRIVSMAPSVTEILFAVGVGDTVVGVTDACDYPAEALEIDKIRESYGDFNIEKIVELEPDLVVMDRYLDLYPPGFWLSKLEEIGLKIVVLYAKTFEDTFYDIQLIGNATLSQEIATELVVSMEQKVEAVTDEVKNLTEGEMPRVFATGFYDGESDPWTSGYGTFGDSVIKMAGGINIAGVKGGYFQMDIEAIIWANPEIIIVIEDFKWPTPTYDALLNDYRLSIINAIENNAVYKIDANLMSRPGPRLVDGLEETARILHPELFS